MFPLKDDLPTRHFPIVTVLFIVLNVAVFGYQLSLPSDRGSTAELAQAQISERDQFTIEYGAIPFRVTNPGAECGVAAEGRQEIVCEREADPAAGAAPVEDIENPPWFLTLVTSMFMHGGILHLAGNMLFLWVFGNNIEDSMGHGRFVAFYLLAGIAAVYSQAALDPDSTVPMIGASGAVAGVLGAYALLHPRARVLTLVFIVFFVTFIYVPAMLLLALWFLLQFLPVVSQLASPELAEGGGVAYFAHVGGFIFGLLAIRLFRRADRADIHPHTSW